MACCFRSNGFSTKLMKQIESKLREIESIYPHTSFSCILSQQGELLAQHMRSPADNSMEDIANHIASLKKAAELFGSTLNQLSCPIIHIRGSSRLFSCYELDNNLLAFYTEMHSAELESFDVTEADAKMQYIMSELRFLFQNLVV